MILFDPPELAFRSSRQLPIFLLRIGDLSIEIVTNFDRFHDEAKLHFHKVQLTYCDKHTALKR
jgi:hypothetical protein